MRIKIRRAGTMGQAQKAPSAPQDVASTISNQDECIKRLALLIERKDTKTLPELVTLIVRLTAPIEFLSN